MPQQHPYAEHYPGCWLPFQYRKKRIENQTQLTTDDDANMSDFSCSQAMVNTLSISFIVGQKNA